MLVTAPDASEVSAPRALPVDPSTLAPAPIVTACPELPEDLSWWAEEIVPACAPQPFDGINLCGGACPRPCQIVATAAGVVTSTSAVSYDANGRWLSTSSADASESCTYDHAGRSACTQTWGTRKMTKTVERANGRIIKVVDPDRDPVTFKYDAAGRMRHLMQYGGTARFAYDHAGRVVRDDTSSYKYNRAGQLIQRNGGAGAFSSYTWTNNRLVQIIERQRGMGGDFSSIDITYDANGRPLSIARNGDDIDSPHATTFIYDCK